MTRCRQVLPDLVRCPYGMLPKPWTLRSKRLHPVCLTRTLHNTLPSGVFLSIADVLHGVMPNTLNRNYMSPIT